MKHLSVYSSIFIFFTCLPVSISNLSTKHLSIYCYMFKIIKQYLAADKISWWVKSFVTCLMIRVQFLEHKWFQQQAVFLLCFCFNLILEFPPSLLSVRGHDLEDKKHKSFPLLSCFQSVFYVATQRKFEHIQWKERTDSFKISSDLHVNDVENACPFPFSLNAKNK